MPTEQSDAEALERLKSAVEQAHGASAKLVGWSQVHKRNEETTVWAGEVFEFKLSGHPTAERCYAWSVPAMKDTPERFYAVLPTEVVDSPAKAVQSSIMVDSHKNDA